MCREEIEMKELEIHEKVHDQPPVPKSVEESASQDVVYENKDVEEIPEKSEQN